MFNFDDDKISPEVLTAMEGDQESTDYLANIVIAALKVVDQKQYDKAEKDVTKSNNYREQGNKAYQTGYLQKALIFYNRALAHAPSGSLTLKLAYSNRSAVLFTAEMYKACEKDCKTALLISCQTPKKIVDKLKRRKYQALSELRKMDVLAQHNHNIRVGADNFFKLKKRNNNVPCASNDVDVILDSGLPKVIAKRDIGAGKVVALEKAFVSWPPTEPDTYFSCYYCRKLDLNLVPCSGCTAALFCSTQCQQNCWKEYHSIECQIIGSLLHIDNEDRWLTKPIIKLKNMVDSWEDFVAMSQDFGCNRMKKDSINDIFDGNNPKSMLSFNNNRHFVHGAIYQKSVYCAFILKELLGLQDFWPQEEADKSSAMKAIARIMMHLSLYSQTTALNLITDVNDSETLGTHSDGHRGLFPFIGKLKHCCVPNLQKVTLNNSMALVTLKPIKAGTELTVTHAFHWLEKPLSKSERKVNLLLECNRVCTCFVCTAGPGELEKAKKQANITEEMKRAALESVKLELLVVLGTPVKKCYEQIYDILSSLSDVPFSDEYELVYRRLVCLHAYVLNKKLENIVLAEDM